MIVRTQSELDAALAFDLGVRIARKSEVAASGCWLWLGSHDGRYGRISVAGRLEMAHRAALAAATGAFRDLDADHLCRTTLCVNPAHLEWVTHGENERRKRGDACGNGHAWTAENTHLDARGHRRCRECNRVSLRRRRACREVDIDGNPIGAKS